MKVMMVSCSACALCCDVYQGSGQAKYQTFIDFCKTGKTVCYAEPWASAWGDHGNQRDPRCTTICFVDNDMLLIIASF